jgi:hypothetical protein
VYTSRGGVMISGAAAALPRAFLTDAAGDAAGAAGSGASRLDLCSLMETGVEIGVEIDVEIGAIEFLAGFAGDSSLGRSLSVTRASRSVAARAERPVRSGSFANSSTCAVARRTGRLALEPALEDVPATARAEPPAAREAGSFFLVVRGRFVVDIQCPSSLSPPPSRT